MIVVVKGRAHFEGIREYEFEAIVLMLSEVFANRFSAENRGVFADFSGNATNPIVISIQVGSCG